MWDIPLDAHIHASINQVYNGLITNNNNPAAWSHAQLICCNVLKKVMGIFRSSLAVTAMLQMLADIQIHFNIGAVLLI